LTRDQLAAFLTDHQQIKQFELLFSVADTAQYIPDELIEVSIVAGSAQATANEALAALSALAQDTAVDDAVLNAKVQQALDAISGMAQALELMALTPRQEIGTIAPQNSDNVNITGGLISGLDAPLPVASGGIGVITTAANLVFAGPTSGIAAPPAFRTLIAADIPSLTYVTSVGLSAPTGFSVGGSPVTSSGTLAISFAAGYSLPTNASQTNWDTAYSERRQWDGGSTSLVAATGRTSLGASTVGSNLFTLTNPNAITFLRINADNSVSTLDATTFRTAIGAGTGSGTVTSVAALTLGTTGTDLSSTVANGTTTPVITLNVPTASATNRGALSSTDWSTFNGKQDALVSGTNIKTVNGTTLLGSGDLGTIGVAYGGTGLTSLTVNRIPYGNGTSAYQSSANLTFNGTYLLRGGSSTSYGLTSSQTTSAGGAAIGAQTSGAGAALYGGWSGSTAVYYVYGNGNVVNTNNSYGAISDIKLKENITDTTPKLAQLNQVRVVNYNLIGDENKQLGVIAQELEQIFPNMIEENVDRDDEGNDLGTTTKGVKYSVFVPMLIKAIQELSSKVDFLETELKLVKGE
jgi:hypothetical protein